jgi:Alpha-L-arabinofuranosidase B (ABFB) domain
MADANHLPSMSIQSYNYQSMFVRHQNFMGVLAKIETELDRGDATFSSNRADRNPGVGEGIAFRAPNFPMFVLRHQDFAIKLQQELLVINPERPPFYLTTESELFWADSSFLVVPGLADASWVSFRSVNFPDHYIRHRDLTLYLEQALDDLSCQDATFRIVDGFNPGPARPVLK